MKTYDVKFTRHFRQGSLKRKVPFEGQMDALTFRDARQKVREQYPNAKGISITEVPGSYRETEEDKYYNEKKRQDKRPALSVAVAGKGVDFGSMSDEVKVVVNHISKEETNKVDTDGVKEFEIGPGGNVIDPKRVDVLDEYISLGKQRSLVRAIEDGEEVTLDQLVEAGVKIRDAKKIKSNFYEEHSGKYKEETVDILKEVVEELIVGSPEIKALAEELVIQRPRTALATVEDKIEHSLTDIIDYKADFLVRFTYGNIEVVEVDVKRKLNKESGRIEPTNEFESNKDNQEFELKTKFGEPV